MKKFIHHDQVEFIPGLQAWFNICRLINIIQHLNIRTKLKVYNHINRFREYNLQDPTTTQNQTSQ